MRATLVAIVMAAALLGQKESKREPIPLSSADTDAFWAEKTKVLGSMMAQDYRRRSQMVENPAIQAYVEAIGSCLAPHLAGESVKFQFELMKNRASAMHEPIGLPAGRVFVPVELVRDVVKRARSER